MPQGVALSSKKISTPEIDGSVTGVTVDVSSVTPSVLKMLEGAIVQTDLSKMSVDFSTIPIPSPESFKGTFCLVRTVPHFEDGPYDWVADSRNMALGVVTRVVPTKGSADATAVVKVLYWTDNSGVDYKKMSVDYIDSPTGTVRESISYTAGERAFPQTINISLLTDRFVINNVECLSMIAYEL